MSLFHARRAGERAAILAAVCAAAFASPALADPNNNNSEKLRKAVTVDGVRSHLSALENIATANGGNRFAGTPGYDASAKYVFDKLTSAGYAPEYWEFQYDATFEKTPTQIGVVSPNPKNYVNAIDYRLMTGAGNSDVTGNLRRPSGDIRAASRATGPASRPTSRSSSAALPPASRTTRACARSAGRRRSPRPRARRP